MIKYTSCELNYCVVYTLYRKYKNEYNGTTTVDTNIKLQHL